MKSRETFIAPLEFDAGDLIIRCYRPGDGEVLSRAIVASYEHLKPWMPWATEKMSPADGELKVRSFLGRYFLGEEFCLGIWRGAELVGSTGFHLRVGPIGSGNAEVGMWIHAAHAGQGLGKRALHAMLEWGFTEWGWERLVWRCDPANTASTRVAEACGLVLEGTSRQAVVHEDGGRLDMRVYAILRTEWAAGQTPS